MFISAKILMSKLVNPDEQGRSLISDVTDDDSDFDCLAPLQKARTRRVDEFCSETRKVKRLHKSEEVPRVTDPSQAVSEAAISRRKAPMYSHLASDDIERLEEWAVERLNRASKLRDRNQRRVIRLELPSHPNRLILSIYSSWER